MQEKYLPILLNITNKKILIIGAGKACREKLWSLGQIDVEVTVIAPEIHEDFYNKSWIHLIKKKYQKGDLQGYSIVYVGINNPEIENEIRRDAHEQNALINFVDKREFSDFISPSVIQRENFSIFVSTFGKGPGAAKNIRKEIEKNLELDRLDIETKKFILNRKITNS
ncbi:MAG: bifunctional precorrin-2 dehydrogenase/sirohydrochlorin ferrochelatase [Spirochaetia bacterium]|nr:bifunctional precorrin-2 dehydrogenase/sirohydrochlorin ferrochelatase [Spirochaetia bacterium]